MTLLIQTMKWTGPGRDASAETRRGVQSSYEPETFATDLPLSEALYLLREYSEKFAELYSTSIAIEHRLIGVQVLPCNLDDNDSDNARIGWIETMSETLDECIAASVAAK